MPHPHRCYDIIMSQCTHIQCHVMKSWHHSEFMCHTISYNLTMISKHCILVFLYDVISFNRMLDMICIDIVTILLYLTLETVNICPLTLLPLKLAACYKLVEVNNDQSPGFTHSYKPEDYFCSQYQRLSLNCAKCILLSIMELATISMLQ